jgi:flavocytochrome c
LAFFFVFSLAPSVEADSLSRFPVAADVEAACVMAGGSAVVSTMSTNQPGATAEVLKEGLKLGAMPVQLSRIQLGPWTSPDEHGFGKAPFFCLGAGFPYGILVDPETSQRFVNELGNRFERSTSILKLGHPVVCIVDHEGAQHSLRQDLDDLQPTVKQFSSLEELGREYKMDPATLADTVKKYNQGVLNKMDEFGKPFRDDHKSIETPPFYAVRLWPKVHHTMGGLHINESAQVMHVDGKPIKGLFAAGEVTGGIHGGDRLGSCATLDCLTFGRIAGRSAATDSPVLLKLTEDYTGVTL